MVGVGIIGCGSISGKYIDAIAEIPNAKIVAVSSHSISSAKHAAIRAKSSFCMNTEELLQRKDVDAVIICSPSGLHGESTIAAARAGKHVIVEKPIEVTLEKIDAMIAACKENNVQLHCIYNNRYKPVYQFVKRAVSSGRFGKLINANASVRWYREEAYYTESPWRGTWNLDGGGALMNQSIHYVDLLLWLAGDVSHIFGYTRTLLHSSIETEDIAVASLEFANGAIGTLLATTSTYGGFPAELQLTGTRGTAVICDDRILRWSFCDTDPLDAESESYQEEKNARSFANPTAFDHADHRAQLASIVDVIKNGGSATVSGEEARKAVELILHIYESSKERCEETIKSHKRTI